MIDARDMIAVKLLGNRAAVKMLSAIKAGVEDLAEVATAAGVTVAYARLLAGKLIASGFLIATRPADLAGARVTVSERMAELASAIECVDANGEPIAASPPRRGSRGDIAVNVLSCVPCCRSIVAIAVMTGTDYMTAWTSVNDGLKTGVLTMPDGMRIPEALAAGLIEYSAERAKTQAAEVMA